jgi:hypothetical protein
MVTVLIKVCALNGFEVFTTVTLRFFFFVTDLGKNSLYNLFTK